MARRKKKRISFIERLKIKPEKRHPSHSACTIGKSAVDGNWYGWSHRAYAGFKTKREAIRFAEMVS